MDEQNLASWRHGKQKTKQESGGGGAGAVGRFEGRAGADGQHDGGATQGRSPQGGAGAVVVKGAENLECF